MKFTFECNIENYFPKIHPKIIFIFLFCILIYLIINVYLYKKVVSRFCNWKNIRILIYYVLYKYYLSIIWN